MADEVFSLSAGISFVLSEILRLCQTSPRFLEMVKMNVDRRGRETYHMLRLPLSSASMVFVDPATASTSHSHHSYHSSLFSLGFA